MPDPCARCAELAAEIEKLKVELIDADAYSEKWRKKAMDNYNKGLDDLRRDLNLPAREQ